MYMWIWFVAFPSTFSFSFSILTPLVLHWGRVRRWIIRPASSGQFEAQQILEKSTGFNLAEGRRLWAPPFLWEKVNRLGRGNGREGMITSSQMVSPKQNSSSMPPNPRYRHNRARTQDTQPRSALPALAASSFRDCLGSRAVPSQATCVCSSN